MPFDDNGALLDRVPDGAPIATSIVGTLPYTVFRCRRGLKEHGAAKLGGAEYYLSAVLGDSQSGSQGLDRQVLQYLLQQLRLYNESVATLIGYVDDNMGLTVSKTARAACASDCDVAWSVDTRAEESRNGRLSFIVMSSSYVPFGRFGVLHVISAVLADQMSCGVGGCSRPMYGYSV
jgi:hypothetical protein